ncbi:sulfurtransferase [Corynebacterium epidermidicanis]|uniref:Sulfurtransferase n=1 Tax=Corynebacterium epidermidicanis TaxID=1050174 RepID=A0A0G3GMK5_9CORY|nr:sulfurtransferase [Corynebacterium epidermidicanis]AKK02461.1 rhodanese-related sulfurtransferase [Corynebacterium epidermidicanis]
MGVPVDPHPKFADYARPERLVSAQWLSAKLGTPGLKVIESDEDSLLYDIGHIPTAQRIDWHKDLSDLVTREFISPEGFANLMNSKGIAPDDTVVIYGDKSNWWAAYTFWVFELYGHADVRLLDGGRDAWMAEERDTSYDVPQLPSTNYPVPTPNVTATRIFVDEITPGSPAQLVDVRRLEEYMGLSSTSPFTVRRSGHIPGAVNVPWHTTVMANSYFRSRSELDQQFTMLDPGKSTAVYCQLGDRSAHMWFVLKYLLGFSDVRNYDGSWLEWGNMVKMPVVAGEQPGKLNIV